MNAKQWLRVALVGPLWLVALGQAFAEPPAPANDAAARDAVARKLEGAGKKLEAAGERARQKLENAAQQVEEQGKKAAQQLQHSAQVMRDEGQRTLKDAERTADEVGQQLQSALADVKGAGDRTARTSAARRSAWQRYAGYAKRPSDIPASARVELRIHSRRMARLARARALAEYEHDQASVRRADALSAREQTRHRNALAQAWPALNDPKARIAEDEDPEGQTRAEDDEPETEP